MLEKIKALLAEELGVNADEITAETSFKEDLGADSLDLFELVTNLEEEYNIEIPAEQLEEMTTVGKVIDYLKSIHIEAYSDNMKKTGIFYHKLFTVLFENDIIQYIKVNKYIYKCI